MRQTHRLPLAIALLLVLLVAACSGRWSWEFTIGSQPRPAPQPTLVEENSVLRPTPLPTPTLLPIQEQIALSTEEQMAVVFAPERDLRELAMRLMPDVGEIPLVVNETTPEYEVGDRIEFWAHDMDAARDFLLTAELIHKTDVAYAWVEVDQRFDRERLIETIDRFSESTYPALRAFFGSEWNSGVDNDPRLHILHATGLGSFIAGYYSSSDEYSRLAQPTSNEKEMFYIDLDWVNSLVGTGYTGHDTVLAHEFQHMIHWYTDMNEETWVGEGLSEFAQDVAGFGPTTTFSSDFLRLPDTQLTSWGDDTAGNDPHYGAAYLFMAYFAQRFGSDLTRAMVAHPANGVTGINEVLAAAGSDLTFDDVFADWVVANYAEDPDALGLDGIYGYRDLNLRTPTVAQSYSRYPVNTVQSQVYNYGTDYLLLEGEGDVVFHFQGETTTQLANLPVGESEKAWWSNRGDASDMRLTRRFDLSNVPPGSDVEMTATMWWDIEDGYDFLYVVASRDGEKWSILEGTSTRASDGVSSFGPGYTGKSGAWQTERFDLSDYVGGEVYVRFEYVTDDAINGRGLFLREVTVPAINYTSNFAEGDGWESEGWIFTDNRLRQGWIVQVMTFEDGTLVGVDRLEVDDAGRASFPIAGLGNGRSAVVAISGAAPVILETAKYEYWIDRP
jgi:immune inhibitor A